MLTCSYELFKPELCSLHFGPWILSFKVTFEKIDPKHLGLISQFDYEVLLHCHFCVLPKLLLGLLVLPKARRVKCLLIAMDFHVVIFEHYFIIHRYLNMNDLRCF